ncbi:hypothetical protein C0V97_15570 [Asaia sp. W19]|uniref:hypothetical protein n=1 Tax=unclassified Asaia TaxID=2685023 RepID=UPI000F8DD268|nr:hypothetical protein [Asaia sp. W19]RUT24701.1 hypothetical protein C0V97_15570 [Asaia sp. W19]
MSAHPLFALAGGILVVMAGMAFYLAAHQQQLLARRLPLRPAVLAGMLLLVLSMIGLATATSPLVGVFASAIGLMVVLSLLPVTVAVFRRERSGS